MELRAYVEQAKAERRAMRIKDVEWQRGPGEAMWLEIHVNPLVDVDNGLLESTNDELQAINTARSRSGCTAVRCGLRAVPSVAASC